VTVTVDDDHLDAVDEVAAELSRRGMDVEAVLGTLGMVTGTVERPEVLRTVSGVLSVDADEEVRIPPPDADVQ
jgi:hypothetical protein